MSEYFLKPKYLGENKKVKSDLSNYATKADLKNAASGDTSNFAKIRRSNYAKIKNIEDKILDITNLATITPLNASK